MRARTSGVPKVTTAIASRAIISGPARLRIDGCLLNAPPPGDGGQPGRVRQRAVTQRLSQIERPGPRGAPASRSDGWRLVLRRVAAAAKEREARERQQEPRALRARAGAAASGGEGAGGRGGPRHGTRNPRIGL